MKDKPVKSIGETGCTDNEHSALSSGKTVRSTLVVSALTLLCRVLGFVRDIVLALIFGAGPAFDAFIIAFKLPNFMRRLFAEGAFAQAFVPVLSEYRSVRTHGEVRKFLNHIFGTLSVVLLAVVLLAELLAPAIVFLFAPGFVKDPVRFHYATQMLHITFPYLFLIALTAFAGSIFNTYNHFALPAFTPLILNVVMIMVAWLWVPHVEEPIFILAWGVVLGGLGQLLLQLPLLAKMKLLPKPVPVWRDPGVMRVMKLMVPALFGVSVAQISLLVDSLFASFLQAGSISWLYYSDRLVYLPQGVISVALATVILPNLSRFHTRHDPKAYSLTLDWAIRLVLLVGVPAATGLCLLAGPILASLMHQGAFSDFDVLMSAKSLRALAVGLPAFMLIKILASAFYSRQNIKTPVKVAVVATVASFIFNLILVVPLAHAGLALSTALASLFNAACLFVLLRRNGFYVPGSGWGLMCLRFLVANSVMAGVLFYAVPEIQSWLHWSLGTRIWHLLALIMLAILTYGVSLLFLGLRKNHLRPSGGEA